jgi:hypothetical protein
MTSSLSGRFFKKGMVLDPILIFGAPARVAFSIETAGIVSKRVDGVYRSGPNRGWVKVRNPASIAVQRERSEKWSG